MGLFNFGSKKKEVAAVPEPKLSSAPTPKPADDDGLPSLSGDFSGSSDLKLPEDEISIKDPSMLEINEEPADGLPAAPDLDDLPGPPIDALEEEAPSPSKIKRPQPPEEIEPLSPPPTPEISPEELPMDEVPSEDEGPPFEVEVPTQPLEFDSPPIPEKLDLGDMNDIYTGLDDFKVPPKKEAINTGIEKLELRRPKRMPPQAKFVAPKPTPPPPKPAPPPQMPEPVPEEPAFEEETPENLFDKGGDKQADESDFLDEPVIEESQAEEPEMEPTEEEDIYTPTPVPKQAPQMHTQVVQTADGKRPLYLDLVTFKNIEKIFDSFASETKLAEDTLYRLTDIHRQQEDQFNGWQDVMEDIEKRLVQIDKSIFKA